MAHANTHVAKDPRHPVKLRAEERRPQVWALKLAGASLRTIAQQLGVSKSTIANDIDATLKELRAERDRRAGKYLDLELARLDNLLLKLSTKVNGGDIKAIGEARRIIEARAQLLGLNAPIRHEHTGVDGAPIEVHDQNVAWMKERVEKAMEHAEKRKELPEPSLMEDDMQPPVEVNMRTRFRDENLHQADVIEGEIVKVERTG